MAYQYIISLGDFDVHESYMADWATNALRDEIAKARNNGYGTMPKMSVFGGKWLLWEYYPQRNGCCEVVKCSAPPNRTYRSIEWVLEHIAMPDDIGE
jgi:hypothetical protein